MVPFSSPTPSRFEESQGITLTGGKQQAQASSQGFGNSHFLLLLLVKLVLFTPPTPPEEDEGEVASLSGPQHSTLLNS